MKQRRATRLFIALVVAMACSSARAADEQVPSPSDVFEKRIVPIFKSPNPSSCLQCHLAGVDLKNYIRTTHEETFRSLRDQGLIDLKRPDDSKILRLIQMGAEDQAGAALIHAKTRQAEFDAFKAWVVASCSDAKLRDLPKLDGGQLARPPRPVEVIRHARTDQLLEAFERNVWAWRFRCMNCHTAGTSENDKHRKEHGDRVAWVKSAGAEATMRYLMSSKLIDSKAPEQSLLLRKPLGTVEHGGGIKFLLGDQAYKGFRAWIEDYAAIVGDKYTNAASLPPPHAGPERFGSDIWFKLTDTPADWGDRLLQINLYAWDFAKGGWERDPIATSDRGVWGKGRLWQHNLTLLATKGTERAKSWASAKPSLPRGRYFVKVFVDREGRLARDWTAALSDAEFEGQAEVNSGWPEGYGRMTSLAAEKLNR